MKVSLVFLHLSNSVLLNVARRAAKKFDAIFINKLDIRLFGYSISERARAPIPREKETEEYLSIADGLTWRRPGGYVRTKNPIEL